MAVAIGPCELPSIDLNLIDTFAAQLLPLLFANSIFGPEYF